MFYFSFALHLKVIFYLVFINILFDYKCLLENMYLEMKNLKKEKKRKINWV